MLAKLTSKNQITLPKKVMTHFADTAYFEVREEAGRIVLMPIKIRDTEAIRTKLASMGIQAQDVKDAINWARS